jgi:hypothetical protein
MKAPGRVGGASPTWWKRGWDATKRATNNIRIFRREWGHVKLLGDVRCGGDKLVLGFISAGAPGWCFKHRAEK